jgi:hypothetical protein
MGYQIRHSNGRTDAGYEDIHDALAKARDEYRDELGRHVEYERNDDGTITVRDPEDDRGYDFLCVVEQMGLIDENGEF